MYLINFMLAIIITILSSVHCDLHTVHDSKIKVQQASAIGGLFEGCYSDSHKSLTATGNYHQSFTQNSNSICVKVCRDNGFAVASTKGADCYCSNSLPVPPLHLSEDTKASGNGGPCSTVCPGAFVHGNCRGDECCGGDSAYSVYIVGSIDILKELINRIAINFKNDPNRMHSSILTRKEKNLLDCQCFNGEVSIYLTANSLNKDGKKSVRTVKSTIDIANQHKVEEVGEQSGLRKVELITKSIEKLLQTDEPILETPFSQWDLLCDNYFGGADLSCQKYFEESAGFTETYSIQHGVSLDVKLGISVENNAFIVKSTKTFEVSHGYSFTKGYSKTTTSTKTEGFRITLTVQKGTKADVRFFKAEILVKVKWRANFFADGDVLIDYGGININKTVHLSRLLSYDQRKLFAIGTIDYGDRPTIIARTRTVDRQGNVISDKEEKKLVE